MAQLFQKLIEPIFSLEEVSNFLSKEFDEKLVKKIDKKLDGAKELVSPRLISVEPLPGLLQILGFNQTKTMEEVGGYLSKIKKVPAPLPYLLGLIKQSPDLLQRALIEFRTIEVLGQTEEFSFPFGKSKKLSQCCLVCRGGKLVLNISEFISRDILNESMRISSRGVLALFFAEEKVQELSEEENKYNFERRIIG